VISVATVTCAHVTGLLLTSPGFMMTEPPRHQQVKQSSFTALVHQKDAESLRVGINIIFNRQEPQDFIWGSDAKYAVIMNSSFHALQRQDSLIMERALPKTKADLVIWLENRNKQQSSFVPFVYEAMVGTIPQNRDW
jgi:hypothetical protein